MSQSVLNYGTWRVPDEGEAFDHTFKILLVGDSDVGKTAMVQRYVKDQFNPNLRSSVGLDVELVSMSHADKSIKLQIWDTAGQEKYKAVATAFYRGGLGFMLVYDITKEKSFIGVRDWLAEIQANALDMAQVVLVGNKADLEGERMVSITRGQQMAHSLGMEFMETSAKDNTNITAVFETLVGKVCESIGREKMEECTHLTRQKANDKKCAC